jgi:hypothetical protein
MAGVPLILRGDHLLLQRSRSYPFAPLPNRSMKECPRKKGKKVTWPNQAEPGRTRPNQAELGPRLPYSGRNWAEHDSVHGRTASLYLTRTGAFHSLCIGMVGFGSVGIALLFSARSPLSHLAHTPLRRCSPLIVMAKHVLRYHTSSSVRGPSFVRALVSQNRLRLL